jgi:hypothetical protein
LFEMRTSAAVLLPISSKLVTEQVASIMLVTSVAEVAASNLCRDTDRLRSRFSWLLLKSFQAMLRSCL